MCGICGVFNFESREKVDARLLKRMADTLVHRGPDDEGFFISGPVGLAHRRLSIIDLEGGHQPMTNEDGTIWVVFNGEIYNFQELHAFLEKKGHTFKTRSDTEVLVHLYEEYGEACFERLRGMFAIAIWDGRDKNLILARDRVGKKPLYYYYDGKRVLFGSEMKAIVQMPGISRELDPQAISDYFSLLYIPAPKSIFKSIRKLQPGHYAVFSERGVRVVEYWDINFERFSEFPQKEWEERIVEKLREAVAFRLISDVPLGAFLSGGIDSSAVVALMKTLVQDPIVTASIGFEEKEFNELEYARVVASKFHTNHYEHIVRPDALQVTERLVWHYDEPFADSSAIPTYYVSQLARNHVTVALSGDGGDELFAGYRRYFFDRRENQIRGFFPAAFRRNVFGTLASFYPKADWAPRVFRGKATLQNLSCSHIEGYFRSVSAVNPEIKHELLSQELLSVLHDYDTLNIFRNYYEKMPNADPMSRILYVDIKTYLTDDILVKVDRASMAHSLEVRAPFLDHEFMELAAQIPSTLKLADMSGKIILKKAFEEILPKNILYRNKMGFGVPIKSWFRKDLKEMAHSYLIENKDDEVLNQPMVKELWREHQSGLRDRSTELWTLLMFQMWRARFAHSL